MSSTNFIDQTTPIVASWLNDVNTATYTTVPANTSAIATEVTNRTNADTTIVNNLSASTGSSLVGQIASGTGATARTVQSKLRESVSVKDFGAIGDGVADDTTAIQNALNTLSATGGTLYFPQGTYLTNSINLLGYNNITLQGVNPSTEYPYNPTSVLKIKTACAVGVQLANTTGEIPTGSAKGVTINNLYINANNLATVGINMQQSTKLNNVLVRYATSHGIVFVGGSYPISLNHVVSQYNGGDGVRIMSPSTTVYNITNSEFSFNTGNGLGIYGGSTCVFENVLAQSNTGNGFLISMLDPATYTNPIFLETLTFIGCYTEANSGYGLYVTSYNTTPSTYTGKIINLSFIGCSFNSSISQQVYIRGTSNLSSNSNYINTTTVSPLYNSLNIDAGYYFPTLNLAAGNIVFPATQNPSTNANTLDDYEEGTWTPTPTSLTVVGTPTYAGKYTKIGNLVFATITITSTTTTASNLGNTSFTLPFTAVQDSALCNAVNKTSLANYAGGLVTGTIVYAPTWPAVASVALSFQYFQA